MGCTQREQSAYAIQFYTANDTYVWSAQCTMATHHKQANDTLFCGSPRRRQGPNSCGPANAALVVVRLFRRARTCHPGYPLGVDDFAVMAVAGRVVEYVSGAFIEVVEGQRAKNLGGLARIREIYGAGSAGGGMGQSRRLIRRFAQRVHYHSGLGKISHSCTGAQTEQPID
jgi:hypothetical protein